MTTDNTANQGAPQDQGVPSAPSAPERDDKGYYPVGTPERSLQMANIAREGRGEKPLTMEEFRAAMGEAGGEKPAEDKPEGDKPAEDKPAADKAEDAAKGAVENAGLKWDDLGKQVLETGTIGKTEREALNKIGIPDNIIDDYIALAKSTQERATNDALSYAGGEKGWKELSTWAATNLNDAEKAAVNSMLGSPAWKTAIDTLRTKMEASRKTAGEPRLEVGSGVGGGVVGYRAKAEQARDINSPRYKTDAAFREEVALKTLYATWDLDRAPSPYAA